MNKSYCKIGNIKKSVDSLNPYSSEKYNTRDEVANGRLFADVFRNYARYNVTSKSWYVYNGIIWEEDVGGMIVERYAKLLYKSLWAYSGDKEKSYQSYIMQLGTRSKRAKMIDDAREHYHISHSDFDSDGALLNLQNGVLNLNTGELIEHSPDLLLSKVANVSYIPDCRSELFERYMSEIMFNDTDKIQYVQKILGYGCTSDTSEEECYMIYGRTTRNGKSTLLETISYMLGDYALNMSPETLAQRKKDSRTASGDIARLNGCRMLHMSEPPKRMVFDVALLKTLTGRDKITARELYQREYEFYPQFKLYINTNYLPIVNDDSLFTSGRIKVITFDRHFSDSEQDKTLKDRLKTEENLSGILNWCLDGLRMYREEGLTPPDAVRDATNDYREKSDKIKLFIDDCFVEDNTSTIKMNDVYTEYVSWCHTNGYGTESKRNFFEELKTKGLVSDTGTIRGQTVRNVVKGYRIERDMSSSEEDENPFN